MGQDRHQGADADRWEVEAAHTFAPAQRQGLRAGAAEDQGEQELVPGEREGAQDAVVEGLFRACFADGLDIDLAAVLADIGMAAGMRPERVAGFLAGAEGAAEVRAAEGWPRQAGVEGVPSFFVDGQLLFSGAHTAATMAEYLRRAVGPSPALDGSAPAGHI